MRVTRLAAGNDMSAVVSWPTGAIRLVQPRRDYLFARELLEHGGDGAVGRQQQPADQADFRRYPPISERMAYK